ncbi:MAG: aminotransferase [Hyphomicrobiaceae bacterium]
MQQLTNSAVRDIETLLHPTTNLNVHREKGPLVLERGAGVYVYDVQGRRYLEGLAGLWCTGLGYGHPELVETARKQMEQLSFTHLFGGRSREPAIELAERLKALSPAPTSKVFFTSSGSEANDTQIKLTWYLANARGDVQRKKIISRMRGYHGVTIGSGSLTGLPTFHADFDLPMSRVLHTDCPHYWRNAEAGESEEEFSTRMAERLEAMILREGPETVAAFIAEPLQGAGGVILPPKSYFQKVQKVLDRYGIRFIVDEVICGFGRTGNWFGSQTYGLKPDTISVAKAITSAYVPLGAVTVSEEDYELMLEASRKNGMFAHGFTYTGHPLACAVANKTLEIYERDRIVEHVRRVAPIFQTRLQALASHPLVGEARGIGLIGGLELVADKETKASFPAAKAVGAKVVALAEEQSLICRAVGGDTVAMCPPLIITGAQINEAFDALGAALDKTLDWVRASP